MKHTIRRTLLTLAAGVVVQRGCQLVAFLIAGAALGVAGLGVLAQGQAMAAVLAVLAGAGVANLTARAIAAQPTAARALISAAVRRRLRIGGPLAAAVVVGTWLGSERPWFWTLCALQVLPAAFDGKQLADATGRARAEVGLESATGLLNLLAVLVCTTTGHANLEAFAAIGLATKGLYAVGAVRAMRRLPLAVGVAAPSAWRLRPALGQLAHEGMGMGDVWLVATMLGDAAAGYYALAARFAAAALLPSVQLARLLLPHLLHAGAEPSAARTLGTALRATAFATFPMVVGGLVTANGLCRLGGEAFGDAGPTLILLLLAGCLQHLGWQCSNTLLALRRDRAFAHGFGWPALLHAVSLLALPALAPANGAAAAVLAGAVAVIAQAAYASTGLVLLQALWQGQAAIWRQPLAVATLTVAAAALPRLAFDGGWLLPAELLAGAIGYGLGLWWFELRGRWRAVGDGLVAASGFRA